mgnify:CR=1 FL=1
MSVTLTPTGDDACQIQEKTASSSALFPIPASATAVVALLKTLLADPDAREAQAGPVSVDRMRDGVRLHVGSGNFLIKYADLFPLVA